jgi:hypothetical protein
MHRIELLSRPKLRVVAPKGGGERGGGKEEDDEEEGNEDSRRKCNFSQQQETYPVGRLKGGVDIAAARFFLLVAVAFPPLHLQPH